MRRAGRPRTPGCDTPRGLAPPGLAPWPDSGGWVLVLAFSAAVNLLMLAGPVFMLQLYDTVLPSGSGATLAALFALVCLLYAVMAALDVVRLGLASALGARAQARLDQALTEARAGVAHPADADTIRRALASPGMIGCVDLMWTPLFLGVLFVLHPWLGWAGLGGAAVLAGGALLHHGAAGTAARAAGQDAARAAQVWDIGLAHAAGGPPPPGWAGWRTQAGRAAMRLGRNAALHTGLSRGFRLFFLQSALLAIGAWLVLRGQTTPGVMVAATILVARALAPLEQAAAHVPLLFDARAAHRRLAPALMAGRIAAETAAPARAPALSVTDVAVLLPGLPHAALRGVSFNLRAGMALGVIGPQGAGKSVLLRALAGQVPLASGGISWWMVPLDAARIGYLPQRVDLVDGSAAFNITLGRPVSAATLARVARVAGLQALLARLPRGIETPLGTSARPLSGGEAVLIGLARALIGKPRLLLLDDPQSGLDAEGTAVVQAAVRAVLAEGGIVVMTAQRPSAVACCDWLLWLDDGRVVALGPRDAVLRQLGSGGPAARAPLPAEGGG